MSKFIYDNDLEIRRFNPISVVFFVLLIALLCLFLWLLFKPDHNKVVSKEVTILNEEQKSLRDFFVHHGSPAPEQMAIAVTSTKRPALMAAIAVKESNGNPQAVGDGGDSHGAFQVQPKHWGKVPSDAVGQALQAERILEELVAAEPRRSLRRALAKYNGGVYPRRVSYKYADRIIELKRKIKL